jgi:fermentation-respiration switch protein FrsA (DUF1100 family)
MNINTEDFGAAVDFLGLYASVDHNRIGILGICGFGGMALTATTSDSRIRAVATVSMYDTSRSVSCGHRDSYAKEQRVAGENAHSRYYSEDVYELASEPKELLIVPGADHVDLYDRMDNIPFDTLAEFFTNNLGATTSTQARR